VPTQGKGEKTDQGETKSNPKGDFHLTPLGVSRKEFAMFRHDQTEPKIDKQKTDLLTHGTMLVHFMQDAKENEIGSNDKDNRRYKKKRAQYELREVHPFQSIWPLGRLTPDNCPVSRTNQESGSKSRQSANVWRRAALTCHRPSWPQERFSPLPAAQTLRRLRHRT
jgi:hypothetical protein